MEVYVLIIADRHVDTDVEVYKNVVKAIKRARAIAEKYARNPDDIEEKTYEGWLYYAGYSCEGDHVRVLAKQLQ